MAKLGGEGWGSANERAKPTLDWPGVMERVAALLKTNGNNLAQARTHLSPKDRAVLDLVMEIARAVQEVEWRLNGEDWKGDHA